MQERGIYAHTGSGAKIIPLIENRIAEAVLRGDIPASFYDQQFSAGMQKVQEIEDNLIILANYMADDAIANQYGELHEWTLSNVKKKFCPLYPWLREPCNQYDSLIEP